MMQSVRGDRPNLRGLQRAHPGGRLHDEGDVASEGRLGQDPDRSPLRSLRRDLPQRGLLGEPHVWSRPRPGGGTEGRLDVLSIPNRGCVLKVAATIQRPSPLGETRTSTRPPILSSRPHAPLVSRKRLQKRKFRVEKNILCRFLKLVLVVCDASYACAVVVEVLVVCNASYACVVVMGAVLVLCDASYACVVFVEAVLASGV